MTIREKSATAVLEDEYEFAPGVVQGTCHHRSLFVEGDYQTCDNCGSVWHAASWFERTPLPIIQQRTPA